MSRAEADKRLGRGCGRPDCRRSDRVVTVELPERGRRTLCLRHARVALEEHGARLVNQEGTDLLKERQDRGEA